MIRIATALAAATLFSSAALANTADEVTADLSFDRSLLTSEEGATEVLASLEAQARSHCIVSIAGINKITVDRACTNDLVTQAVDQIANDTLSDTFAGTISTF